VIPTFAIKHLKIGDRVTVLYHDRNYSSVVQDMPEPDQIVIGQPTNMGIYLNLEEGEEAEIFFKKENGILTFLVAQEDRFMSGTVPMLRLRAASEVRRSQRRSYYRLEKSLPVQLSVKEEKSTDSNGITIKARTINISGGGCRIAIKQPVDNNAMLECKITLSPDLDLVLDGQVVWVERLNGSERTSIIGVQFVDEDTSTQKTLVSYVTNEQRKQLKNK
jgi:c-di-GMP-binding flagellar brake protein YcgR